MTTMTSTQGQTRQRIGMAAFFAAFSVVVLWLGWATVVTGMLDKVRAARAADEAARVAAEIARAEQLVASRRGG
jgi:hypothetical protein